MNDIAATIGISNFKHIDEIVGKHQSNANFYDEELKDVKGVTLLERKHNHKSSFWIYSMLVDRKDEFMEHMKKCKIMVSQVHERNDIHSCVKEYSTHLPSLDWITPRLISIPVGWWVTEKDRRYIVDCIKKGW